MKQITSKFQQKIQKTLRKFNRPITNQRVAKVRMNKNVDPRKGTKII